MKTAPERWGYKKKQTIETRFGGFSYYTPVWISFIYRESSASKGVVIYADPLRPGESSMANAASAWSQIVNAANSYDYAEHVRVGYPLKNWPNSKYQLPPGNNSNTFIHEMAAVIDRSANVYRDTPGSTKAKSVNDRSPTPVYRP